MTDASPNTHLTDYRLVLRWPVQWGDQDAFGHVNNTVYFRWFETGRIDYMSRLGFDPWYEQHKIGPILASIRCDYRRQVKYPDEVEIGTRVTRLGRSSVQIEHRIYSRTQQTVVAEGDSTIVVFDYLKQKPTGIPDEIRQAIEAHEGRTFDAPEARPQP